MVTGNPLWNAMNENEIERKLKERDVASAKPNIPTNLSPELQVYFMHLTIFKLDMSPYCFGIEKR